MRNPTVSMSGQFGKEEIVHLHLLLFQIKKVFESAGIENEYFYEYDSMKILPVQIFRQKIDHIDAIMKLCYGIIGREEEIEKVYQAFRGVLCAEH